MLPWIYCTPTHPRCWIFWVCPMNKTRDGTESSQHDRPCTHGSFPTGITHDCPTNWNLAGCYGARVDRRLAPRVYEGGATSSQTGGGGSPSPVNLSQKGAKNKDGKHRKIILFDALLWGICTPPGTSVRYSYHPPHKCGGRGRLRRQPYKFQFICFIRNPPRAVHHLKRSLS